MGTYILCREDKLSCCQKPQLHVRPRQPGHPTPDKSTHAAPGHYFPLCTQRQPSWICLVRSPPPGSHIPPVNLSARTVITQCRDASGHRVSNGHCCTKNSAFENHEYKSKRQSSHWFVTPRAKVYKYCFEITQTDPKANQITCRNKCNRLRSAEENKHDSDNPETGTPNNCIKTQA